MMHRRKKLITTSEYDVENQSMKSTILLATLLAAVFKRSVVTRLAVIGAMFWLVGSSPMTAAQAQTAGSTIVVNSAADGPVVIFPGQPLPCTLRDAIAAANTNRAVGGCAAGSPSPAVDTILFNIGAGTPTIRIRTQLPAIVERVIINGESSVATRVELDGTRASLVAGLLGHRAHGLFLATGDSTIRNMVINRFNGDGIVMTADTGGHIENFMPPTITDRTVPTDPPCWVARPAEPDCGGGSGGSGGPDIPDVFGSAGRNKVIGCFIGTDASGTLSLGNGSGPQTAGIVTDTSMHTIGGSTAAERNVISGNFGQGLILGGRGHWVRGNFIGADASGNQPLGNQYDGINIAGGQFSNGMGAIGASTVVTDAQCGLSAGNDRRRCGNRIAFNGSNGITTGFNRYEILSNAIFSNTSLGIDLDGFGVTPNTPNRLRNSPLLGPCWSWFLDLSTGQFVLSLDVTIDSGNQPVTLQMFRNSSCDPSGSGEGEELLKTVTGLMNGVHHITIPASSGFFTATATTALGTSKTSEFSNCLHAGTWFCSFSPFPPPR
jgi:CSLREA domain-containing protein